jgi:hypothetical protein
MVAIIPAKQSQFFTPIPAIGQNIKFAGHGQAQTLKDLFGQGDLGVKTSAPLDPLGVVKPSPQGQDRLFIEERRQNPLVAKDIREVLGMILIPSAAGNLLSRFFDNRIVQEEKDDGARFNLEGLEEFLEGQGQDLIPGPGILSQETGETGERSGKKRASQRFNHGRGVPFFSQLDEAKNERGKEFERRT